MDLAFFYRDQVDLLELKQWYAFDVKSINTIINEAFNDFLKNIVVIDDIKHKGGFTPKFHEFIIFVEGNGKPDDQYIDKLKPKYRIDNSVLRNDLGQKLKRKLKNKLEETRVLDDDSLKFYSNHINLGAKFGLELKMHFVLLQGFEAYIDEPIIAEYEPSKLNRRIKVSAKHLKNGDKVELYNDNNLISREIVDQNRTIEFEIPSNVNLDKKNTKLVLHITRNGHFTRQIKVSFNTRTSIN